MFSMHNGLSLQSFTSQESNAITEKSVLSIRYNFSLLFQNEYRCLLNTKDLNSIAKVASCI